MPRQVICYYAEALFKYFTDDWLVNAAVFKITMQQTDRTFNFSNSRFKTCTCNRKVAWEHNPAIGHSTADLNHKVYDKPKYQLRAHTGGSDLMVLEAVK